MMRPMPSPTKPNAAKLIAAALPLMLAVSSTVVSAAPVEDPDAVPPDARLEGFVSDGQNTALMISPQSGNAGTWFLAALFGVLCFGVLCKNGKRTHLD